MQDFKFKMVHITTIQAGDAIEHEGRWMTVCAKDIKTGGFMGTTIFGDSYRMGHVQVKKAIFN
jgi:hypothetical protein